MLITVGVFTAITRGQRGGGAKIVPHHRRTQGGSNWCNAPTFGFAPIFYFCTQVQGWVQKKLSFYILSSHIDTSPFLFDDVI